MYTNKKLPSIDIIIRTKNEEKWIGSCLRSIKEQIYPPDKVKVIIVDNNSSDETISKVKKFKNIKVVKYNPEVFKPGEALNKGANKGNGDILVFLSAHCIPADNKWLYNLIKPFKQKIAGIYGKQIPYQNSHPSDKRDLFNQFGEERKLQKKESFFHNANSAIQRKIFKNFPFNEILDHIEDRFWAKKILKEGYHIIYEPKASVIHFHGLNHGNNLNRANGVAKIIDEITIDHLKKKSPLDTHLFLLLISYDESISESIFIKRLNRLEEVFSDINKIKFKFVIINQKKLKRKEPKVSSNFKKIILNPKKNILESVIDKHSFFLKNQKLFNIKDIDGVIIIDLKNIIKNKEFYQKAIWKFVSTNFESVIPAVKDYSMYWQKSGINDEMIRLDSSNDAKNSKNPIYKSNPSLFTITKPTIVANNNRVGDYTGCIVIQNKDIEFFDD